MKLSKTDDVGSFPLPDYLTLDDVENAGALCHKSISRGITFTAIKKNRFVTQKFVNPVIDIYLKKLDTGLDYPNYPQFREMNKQFSNWLADDLTIESEKAFIPEIKVLEQWAKEEFENTSHRYVCRACFTGPLELAIHKLGPQAITPSILERVAESVAKFVENLQIFTEYFTIPLVAIDEPSIGLRDLPNLSSEDITKALTIATDPIQERSQKCEIHLHSLSNITPVWLVEKITIIGAEFAADPSNFGVITPALLKEHHKYLRAGIAVTSFDHLVLDYAEKHKIAPKVMYGDNNLLFQALETHEQILERFNFTKEKYGDLVVLAGPDCGLKSWKSSEIALKLLKNINDALIIK
ncbi:MAG: hypothetical protein ACFFC7_03175 [Candidatus Hermodarchaeota archaeon]